jgi:hypothetical protein
MSLPALSTELDNRILDFLDYDALNAISKISKYYRSVAEARLYRNLHLDSAHIKIVQALLLTLVSRPDLAAHIASIKLSSLTRASDEANHEGFYQRSLQQIPAVQAAMAVMRGPGVPAKLLVDWMGAVTGPHAAEGGLAFILGCATNIQCLHVSSGESDAIVLEIVSAICRRWSVGCPIPFHKLRILDIGC